MEIQGFRKLVISIKEMITSGDLEALETWGFEAGDFDYIDGLNALSDEEYLQHPLVKLIYAAHYTASMSDGQIDASTYTVGMFLGYTIGLKENKPMDNNWDNIMENL